ncbi:hypothetical protein BDR22DRAFT_820162 [Usnea florida]
MFHKYLDQASKRFKEHPNVAAIYISLPQDEADRAECTLSPRHPIKVRDFAYNQHDSEPNTRDFIANFGNFGFESHHKRVNNGDLLSKAGFLAYEKVKLFQELPTDLKARFSGFFDLNYHPPKCEERSTSETITGTIVDSASLDPSGTTATSSLATKATAEPSEEEVSNGRPRAIRDNELLLAVAACMVEYKRR